VAGYGDVVSVEDAAAMGFKSAEAEQSLALLAAVAAPPGAFAVAMDLARYVRVPLVDATAALVLGPRRLRGLGLAVPDGADPIAYVGAETAGMAKAYTTTLYGSLEVREAQGHTFSRAFNDLLARWFGPR
jgi:hypothetical protein